MLYMFTQSIARFMVMLILVQSLSFAADLRIPAKQSGPLSSLAAAGRSIDLLTSLKDENGHNLKPEDNGKWQDRNFFLPESAKPNREGRLKFIAKIHGRKAGGSKASAQAMPSCPKQGECPKCPMPQQPQTTPPTKEHPFVLTSEDVTVEVGKTVVLAGFADESGRLYQLEADQSVANVAKFSSAQRITIVGLKPGTVTFTVWPTVDKNIRKLITVKVVAQASSAKVKAVSKGNGNWFVYLLGICTLGLLALMVYVVRKMTFPFQGTAQKSQSSESDHSEDGESSAQSVDDDEEFEPEIL